MQLESTLFGVVVVQIKPQLEKLLNLPDDSLTKEIKLTQDLMELFLKYQIPSDLLSFSEPEGATETTSAPARLQTVKGHVKAMLDMIQKEKEAEIEERKKEAQFAQPLIEFDQFGSADMMCLGAAPCGAAPFGGAPFGGIMVSDHCEAMNQSMEVDFGRAPEKKSKGRAMRGRAAPAAPSCPVPAPPAAASATPAATPAPPGSTPPPQKETQHQPDKVEAMGPGSSASVGVSRDYTQVPQQMDEQFEKMDPDSSLRPTIINVGKQWKKRSQKALLAQPTEANLAAEEQKSEKDAAFDLLDAITKSGALPLSHATLRIVIAATHCFDKTVLETVVQENVNPIDKVERSTLIMASTVHQQPTAALINQSSFSRVSAASPQLRSTIKCQEKQDNAWCSSVETNLIPLFQLKSCHPSGNLEGPTNIAGGAPQADRPVLQIWRVDVTAPTISAISRSKELLAQPCKMSSRDQEAVATVLVMCAQHWHADLRSPALDALCQLAEATHGRGPCGQAALTVTG
eukprot:symbB.v1.2.011651.t1/scaffold789.1/size230748/12